MQISKKEISKAYGKYVKKFTPKPKYFFNSVKAFISGGAICMGSLWLENSMIESGVNQEDASVYVVILLIMITQVLTGLGKFDTMAKHAGAGLIIPITGFANAIVAPALEYKKEGLVLGVGAKLFALAGPVLVAGISISVIIGAIYWLLGNWGIV